MPTKKYSFTLIELLVVIAIIGIISGVIIVSIRGAMDTSNDAKRKADISQIASTLSVYGSNNNHTYPIETCYIGSTCSSAVNTALGDAANSKDPKAGAYYSYTSDGVKFTVSATMSDSRIYAYDSATDEYYSDITVAACGTANKTFYASVTDFGSNTFCSAGSLVSTPSFPAIGGTSSWICRGKTDVSCSASRSNSVCIDSSGIDCNEYAVGSSTVNVYTLTGTATASANWSVPTGVTTAEILVVGGGGGGGFDNGGGGGGGGISYSSSYAVTGNYVVTVGAGGASRNNGANSSFGGTALVGYGGGAGSGANGGSTPNNGLAGGSGGGAGGGGGTGIASGGGATKGSGGTTYGNAGGGRSGSLYGGGGGGGAGATGTAAVDYAPGSGGRGMAFDISGTSTYYAGGGGGGGDNYSAGGGAGGGGEGKNGRGITGGAGGGGTGGGGGGGSGFSGNGGTGGSGVVIIKYLTP